MYRSDSLSMKRMRTITKNDEEAIGISQIERKEGTNGVRNHDGGETEIDVGQVCDDCFDRIVRE